MYPWIPGALRVLEAGRRMRLSEGAQCCEATRSGVRCSPFGCAVTLLKDLLYRCTGPKTYPESHSTWGCEWWN